MERRILTAKDGMIFTDGTIYGQKIYLEVGRSAEDFYEISRKEYENMMEEESTDGSS